MLLVKAQKEVSPYHFREHLNYHKKTVDGNMDIKGAAAKGTEIQSNMLWKAERKGTPVI